MRCANPECGLQAGSLLVFCPVCRARLYTFEVDSGQVAAKPTTAASDAKVYYFALIDGHDPSGTPLRVRTIDLPDDRQALLSVDGRDQKTFAVPVGRFLGASAKEQEWIATEA
jgi:hypothetical protein